MKDTTGTAYSHTKAEMRERLLRDGWHTWYNDNYWVHPNLVSNPKAQDYTNYGMKLEDAFIWPQGKKVKTKITLAAVKVIRYALKSLRQLMNKES